MELIKTLFSLCWDILGIKIEVFGHAFTLLQALYFSILAYGLLYLIFRLIGRKGGGDE